MEISRKASKSQRKTQSLASLRETLIFFSRRARRYISRGGRGVNLFSFLAAGAARILFFSRGGRGVKLFSFSRGRRSEKHNEIF
jgi:hypothetical protein